MKLSTRVVSIMVVAAVVVGAGVVGLLIRGVQMGRRRPADVGTAERWQQQQAVTLQRPGQRQANDTAEKRAELQEQRAQMLEKMKSLTEEEKAEFREQIRRQSSQRGTRTRSTAEPMVLPNLVQKEFDPGNLAPQPSDANASSGQDAEGIPSESDPNGRR